LYSWPSRSQVTGHAARARVRSASHSNRARRSHKRRHHAARQRSRSRSRYVHCLPLWPCLPAILTPAERIAFVAIFSNKTSRHSHPQAGHEALAHPAAPARCAQPTPPRHPAAASAKRIVSAADAARVGSALFVCVCVRDCACVRVCMWLFSNAHR